MDDHIEEKLAHPEMVIQLADLLIVYYLEGFQHFHMC